MILSVVLFAIAALGGAYLAARRLGGRPLPGTVAIAHGAAVAAALIALIGVVATGKAHGSALSATVLFVVAALGGFVLASFHLRGRTLPVPLVLIHGGIAVALFDGMTREEHEARSRVPSRNPQPPTRPPAPSRS